MHDAREHDAIVATGEQVTVGLLAIARKILGLMRAHGLDGKCQYLPIMHGAARIDRIDAASLDQRLSQGQVAIIAGFQGIGGPRITTLGRGGSDTSRRWQRR